MNEPLLEPVLRRWRLRQVMPWIPPGAKLLDIGCGRSATFLRTISPHIRQGVGVDFKVEPIQGQNIETIQLKLAYDLPFEDSSFDVVTMLAVLEHIEHEKAILLEVQRVLRDGGKLILTVPSVWSQPLLEFLSYQLKIVDEAEIRDHKRYYNRKKLNQVLINEVGFQEFHHHYFQFWMNNFCTVAR
ncbi:MAG TPA: class I SAM-dependent methyltransferase [Trichocoleus sp.]|jgi:ubiquinone/menaquinone biosynthesis C-methylase UbiE